MKAALASGFLGAAFGWAVLAAGPGAAAGEEPQVSLPAPLPVIEDRDAGAAVGTAMTPLPASVAQAGETVQPDSPAGGSRLLRALAATREPGPATPEQGAPAFPSEGCPRALLRRLLAGAANDAGALTALGIEQEVLALCRERQEIVTGLFETEARLRELRAPAGPVKAESGPIAQRIAETEPPALRLVPAAAAAPPAETQPSPLRAALTATAVNANEADAQAPRFAWFSIIGTAGALRAGITDGSGVWFVREGDALPGGGSVTAIAGRPPGVRVAWPGEADGGGTLLPWRARAGGVP